MNLNAWYNGNDIMVLIWEILYCHSVPLYHWSKNETIFRYDSSYFQAVQCDMPFFLAFLLLDKKALEVARHIFWCHSVRNSTDLRRSPLEGLPPFAIMWFIISLLYSSSKPGQKQSDKVGQTDEITLKFCAPSPIRTCPVPSLVCVSSNKNIHNLTHT